MESQTEQSDSNQPDQPLPDQPLPDQQAELQSQDSLPEPAQSDDLVLPPSEDVDVAEVADVVEVAEPEVEAPVEAPVEVAVKAPEPAPITDQSFSDLNDVDSKMSTFSPEVRAYVAPILALAQKSQQGYDLAAMKFEQAKTELVEFAEAMKDYGVDSAPVAEKFQAQQNQIAELNDSVVKNTWRSFQITHPDYDAESPKLKKVFSELVTTMLDRFPGESTIDKLDGAYKYAKYTVGPETAPKAVVPKAPVAAAPVKQAAPVNVDSKAQALVNDGMVSTTASMVDVAELSWDEILDRHKHLLG